MFLSYVDDVLCISDDPMKNMKVIQSTFKLKDDKINEPKDYLGATLEKMILSEGSQCWSMWSAKYVKTAVQNVKETLSNPRSDCEDAVLYHSDQDIDLKQMIQLNWRQMASSIIKSW